MCRSTRGTRLPSGQAGQGANFFAEWPLSERRARTPVLSKGRMPGLLVQGDEATWRCVCRVLVSHASHSTRSDPQIGRLPALGSA
jgi:hypothetical protein